MSKLKSYLTFSYVVRWLSVSAFMAFSILPASAGSFKQSNWSGGQSSFSASHNTDQTGWTEYQSKDSALLIQNSGEDLLLPNNLSGFTQSSDADFSPATTLEYHNTHQDFITGATLEAVKVNNGAVSLNPTSLSMVWSAKTAWDVSTGGGDYHIPAFADLDGDGDQDMMIAEHSGVVKGYRNIGSDDSPSWDRVAGWDRPDPSFGAATATLGDFDNDGDSDLFVGDQNNGVIAYENKGDASLVVWQRRADWGFTGSPPTNVAGPNLVDMNNDGQLDLMMGGDWWGGTIFAYEYIANSWQRRTAWEPSMTGPVGRPSLGDLDDDGDYDMLVGWRSSNAVKGFINAGTAELPNNWIEQFTFNGTPTVTAYHDHPVLVDIDSDGDLDILLGSGGDGAVPELRAYENNSTIYAAQGTYTSTVIDIGGNAALAEFSFNVVKPTDTSIEIDVRAGRVASPDATWTDWSVASNIASGTHLAPLLSNRRYIQYRARMATISTSVTPLLTDVTMNYIAFPFATDVVAIGGKVSLKPSATHVAWASGGQWSKTITGSYPDTNNNKPFHALGDLNGDGFLDFIVGSDWESTGHGVYRHDGSAGADPWQYQSTWLFPSTYPEAHTVLGDLDGDGDLDVMLNYRNAGRILGYRNDGGIDSPTNWNAMPSWNLTHRFGARGDLADLDNDGDLDMMVTHNSGPHEVWFYENQDPQHGQPGSTGPVWARKNQWDASGFGTALNNKMVALGDLDSDGDIDLVIGDTDDTDRFVFENKGTKSAPVWVENSGWHSAMPNVLRNRVSFADLDGDGDLEWVSSVPAANNGGTLSVYDNMTTYDYVATGTFSSAVMDFGGATNFTTLGFNISHSADSSARVDVRSGNNIVPDVTWTTWHTDIANGGSIAAHAGHQYFQYRVIFNASTSGTDSPILHEVTVNYGDLVSPLQLISSAFNSVDAGNYMQSLSWVENLPPDADVRIQLRTAVTGGGLASAAWVGPDNSAASYWNSSNIYGGACSGIGSISCANMATSLRDGQADQWFQYKVTIVANGFQTPTFSAVTVAYIDTLPAGITLSKSTGLVTAETQSQDSFTVVLDAPPASASVELNLAVDAPDEVVLSNNVLTFDSANWNVPVTVTITGVDDFIDDGDVPYTLTVSVNDANTADPTYDALANKTVSGVNIDNDTHGILINKHTLSTSEDLVNDSFTVVLTSEPVASVKLNLTLNAVGADEVSLSAASLTFDANDWSVPRSVTVIAEDEGIDDGDAPYTLTVSVDQANTFDSGYDFLADQTLTGVNTDNDTAGISVSPISGLVTSESGTSATFDITLASQPSDYVVIDLSSSNGTEAYVRPTQVVFTPSNWQAPHTIVVTGKDDGLEDGNIGYTILTSKTRSADPVYDGWDLEDVTATNVDNDNAAVVVMSEANLRTTEAGGSAKFKVVLNAIPLANVALTFVSNDPGEGSVYPPSLVFRSDNWNISRTVIVTGADDPLDDGDVNYTIVTTLDTSDPAFSGIDPDDVSITNLDNDTGGAANGFSQTDWSMGQPQNETSCAAAVGVWTGNQCIAASPINQSGWQAYADKSSKLGIVNNGADLSIPVAMHRLNYWGVNGFASGQSSAVIATNDALLMQPVSQSISWELGPWAITGVTQPPGSNLAHLAPSVGDLNGDGFLDFVAGSNWTGNGSGLGAFVNDGTNQWNYQGAWDIPYSPNAQTYVKLADLDNDGDLDVMVGDSGSNTARAFKNRGGLAAPDWIAEPGWNINHGGSNAASAAFADLDGDGDLDAVIGTLGMPYKVYGYENQTPGGGPAWVRKTSWDQSFPANPQNWHKIPSLIDFDRDGDYDLVVFDRDGSRYFFENQGNAFAPLWVQKDAWLPPIGSLYAFADMDGDGDYDGLVGQGVNALASIRGNGSRTYPSTASYTSAAIDVGKHLGFTSLDYTATIRANTSLSVEVRSGVTNTPDDGSWSAWTTVASGGSLASFGSHRYIQYRIIFGSSAGQDLTAELHDLTINYEAISAHEVLISSPFDTGLPTNIVTGLGWRQTLLSRTDVQIQLRSAANNGTEPGIWSEWSGPDGSADSYWSSSNYFGGGCVEDAGAISCSDIAAPLRNGQAGQWLQYKIVLISGGTAAPSVSDIQIYYDAAIAGDVLVTPTTGLTTTENGASAQFTVRLNSVPSSAVMINLASSDLSEAWVSPTQLSFNASDWHIAKTVTVTGVADSLADGNKAFSIYTSATISDDPVFANRLVSDVTATNIDTQGSKGSMSVSPVAGLVTNEAGSMSSQFSIVLDSPPSADVSIILFSDDTSEGSVSPSSLTFSSNNWNVPKYATVQGVDDDEFDQTIHYHIITNATSNDPNFAGADVADVAVINLDNEAAQLVVHSDHGYQVSESGALTQLLVSLSARPGADVTTWLTTSDSSEGMVIPFYLRFTPENWDVPQYVTVSGRQDNIQDGDMTFEVVTSAFITTDPQYSGLNPDDISILNIDDDIAYEIKVNPSKNALITSEMGGAGTILISLNIRPTADVIIDLFSDNTSEGVVPEQIILRPDDTSWRGVYVEVSGVDDRVVDGDQRYKVITGVARSEDPHYNGIDPIDIDVINVSSNTRSVAYGQGGASTGQAVSIAGDFNGDGFDDFVVGSPAFSDFLSNEGRVDLYYGNDKTYLSRPAKTLYGGQSNAQFGYAISGVVDLDNDGFDDLLVGAPGAANGGRVYAYYGSLSGIQTTPDHVLEINQGGSQFGYAVAASAKFNGDDFGDLIIGAPGQDKAYVYHGAANKIIPSLGQTLVGGVGSRFGHAVDNAGDVDQDGFDDVIIGAPDYSNIEANEGAAYVFFAHSDGSGIAASADWLFEENQAASGFGFSVAGAGDFDGDGFDDIAIGAPNHENIHSNEGVVFSYYGRDRGAQPSVGLKLEVNQNDAYFGSSLSSATDYNRDGYADLVVGAPGFDADQLDEGRAYVFYGTSSGLDSTGVYFEGNQRGSNFGVSVAGAGDFDNDGYADIVVGANLFNDGISPTGKAFFFRAPPQTVGVEFTPLAELVTREAGTSTAIEVVLTSPPVADVTLWLESSDESEGSLSKQWLSFSPTNWFEAQQLLVRGVDDAVEDGDQYFDINVSGVSSADTQYNSLSVTGFSVTNLDDENTVSVTATLDVAFEESTLAGRFSFSRSGVLDQALAIAYELQGSADAGVDYVGFPDVIVIPAGASSVSVDVTPIDDANVETLETLTLSVLSSTKYLVAGQGEASIAIIDNDVAGISVSPTLGLVSNESGGVARFNVVLNTQPSSDVTIALASNMASEGRVTPSQIVFTNANWNTAQTVTVVGQDDLIMDGDAAFNVLVTVSASLDSNYAMIDPDDVSVTNLDDDLLPNVSATVVQGSVYESSSTGAFVTFSRSGSASSDLTVYYSVSGTALSGTDYYSIGSMTTIPAGSSHASINIRPKDDDLLEGSEVLMISMISDAAYILDHPNTVSITLFDDEASPQPVANFVLSQWAGDGEIVTVDVVLSNEARVYPVRIPVTVTGSATNPADHNAVDTTLVIESGKSATLSFNVVDDGFGDSGETVIYTLGVLEGVKAGPRNSHTITIVEENIAPEIGLAAAQNGAEAHLIITGDGPVVITAYVNDPNMSDSHDFDWSYTNNVLVDIDASQHSFSFDPEGLADGFYNVQVLVTDDGVPAKTTDVDLLIEVANFGPSLTAVDSDSDGVPDNGESFGDTDVDGIPNYLDNAGLASHELQQFSDSPDSYIMRTDVGLNLRLGDVAFAAGSDGALVSQDDIANFGGGEGKPGLASAVDSVANAGGYFDFEIIGLPQLGQSVSLVIPQLEALPSGAVYRKYDANMGWQNFVENQFNTLSSAPGLPGECPLPGDIVYQPGLTAGSYCIQLMIQDGGPNDMDGVANYVIEDPGQLGVVSKSQPITEPNTASGGGTLLPTWLLLLGMAFLPRLLSYRY